MIESPCTKICQIDKNSGICLGCKRNIYEISQWQNYKDEEKKEILDKLRFRKINTKKK